MCNGMGCMYEDRNGICTIRTGVLPDTAPCQDNDDVDSTDPMDVVPDDDDLSAIERMDDYVG